jgi:hypothetical protein
MGVKRKVVPVNLWTPLSLSRGAAHLRQAILHPSWAGSNPLAQFAPGNMVVLALSGDCECLSTFEPFDSGLALAQAQPPFQFATRSSEHLASGSIGQAGLPDLSCPSPSRSAVQNKAHTNVLEHFAYCPDPS